VLARYAASTGHDVDAPVFYYAFGLFKVGVIAQQIYSRYVRGLTRDPRFAMLDRAVAALGEVGVRAVDRGRIGSRR
jgi:aminoglycoside phosphotransferase (APT) family kinase protein